MTLPSSVGWEGGLPPRCQAPAAASELGSKQGGYAPTRNLLRCLSVLQQEEDAKWKSNRSVGLQPSS